MRVLITGATGLIGSDIVKQCLDKGIVVNYLTTNPKKLSKEGNYKGFLWNIDQETIDVNCIKNVDVIIHLVGASISKRWTKVHKQAILDSRLKTTALLYKTLKENQHSVTQIISASAIGYYPDSLTNYYHETYEEASTSFLGKVVKQWESSVDSFKTLNIKVVKVRIGLVFSSKGGAFPQLAKPIKFGLGSVMGSGKQWVSWIHLQDLSNLFMHVLHYKLEGVFNGVSPNPVTNKELTKAIAKQLKRPLFLPNIPKFLMKIVLGEMHILLFESQRVSSKKTENLGFNFKHYNLQSALEELL